MARVLVVEDDEMTRDVVTSNLQRAGHQVVQAGSGQEALDAVAARPAGPEVAVLDIGLPDFDGYTLLRALRDRAELADLPAIFLSARVSDEDISAGRSMGATYLTKPFIASALLAAIERSVATPASW